MRNLEMLLLLADLVALVIMAFPRPLDAGWWRLTTVAAMAIAFAQVGVEGPRWQLVPAYALALLFFLASIACRSGAAADAARRVRLKRIAVGCAAAWLAVAAALPMIAPVFRFPPPTGPYAIGTLTYHWVDTTRSEAFVADPRARRELMVQIWYPAQAQAQAQAQASGPPAAYLPDAGAVMTAFARIQDRPAFIFGHLKYVVTHAMASAPAASDLPAFPVLLFLEGASGFRQMNTYQVEQLASRGYIVVAIDQPGAAAAVVFPDGHQVAGLDRAQFQAAVQPSYLPVAPGTPRDGTPLPPGLARQDGGLIAYLAQDVVFTLDQLESLNRSDPNAILTGKLDLRRVGVFGISLGGIVVGEACRREPRVRACLVMDAAMPTDVVRAGLRQPSMWITRDAASMRLERQRAGGWPEVEIQAHQTSMRAAYEGLPGAGYFVRVPGMFHGNFTDIAIWTPMASLLGVAGPINPQRAHDIVNAYTLAFFDRHVYGRPAKLLEGPAEEYPDAVSESRVP
jgi:predicted dienelactone hydrolase